MADFVIEDYINLNSNKKCSSPNRVCASFSPVSKLPICNEKFLDFKKFLQSEYFEFHVHEVTPLLVFQLILQILFQLKEML
jgi:hypothetical protein